MDNAPAQPGRAESEIFADLAELCRSPGYVHAVAFFCFRDNLIPIGETLVAKDLVHQYTLSRLLRTEISTLIGLLVRGPLDYSLPEPNTFSVYIETTEKLLLEIHEAMSATWFEDFDFTQDPPVFGDPFSSAKNLREPIFYGGESAYGFQYRDLLLLKYGADEGWLEKHKGFSISDAVAVLRALESLQPDRLMATLEELRDKPKQEWTVLSGFEFSAEEISDLSGVATDRIESVLVAFTLPESQTNLGFKGLSDFNATNATPILKSSAGRYLLFQYYSLLEAMYDSPFFWMGIEDKGYAQTAIQHRGAFTEQFAAARLSSVFGPERVFTNVTIFRSDGTTLCEMDGLVLFGDRAIVVQAKSKRLTIEARKGNDLQLKDDFKKAVQDAYDQAYLCATAILDPSLPMKNALGHPVDRPASLRAILPLCIVSDHYPALAFQARQFLSATVTESIFSPLVTDVFALDVMAEMLGSPLHFLHYLHLRARFGEKFMANHELTLLGYHLARNLWGEADFDMMSLSDDIASDLDIAMLARRNGVPGRKTPEGILTKLNDTSFGRLVKQIESSGDPEMTDLGIWLLSLNEKTARDIGGGIDRIAMMTRQNKMRHDITIGVADPPSGLTIHCSYDPAPESMRKLLAHAELRKYSVKANVWYALTVSPENGSILTAALAKFAWRPNPEMDKLTKDMPKPMSGSTFDREMTKAVKIGRNDRCPCGSGKKYKSCCLQRTGGLESLRNV